MATTNKNFKVKNGLDVNGPIGVGTDPDYGIEGQILVSAGSNATPTWSDNSAESTFYLVRNNTGSTIVKGTLVSAYGAEPSGRIDVTPHETTGLQDSELRVMGVATANISNGVNGTVMSFGTLKGIDTRGNVASAIAVGDETWTEGDILFAHPTVAGKLTNVRPQHDLAVAFITVRHASSGQIAVRIIPGNHHLEWLHDVSIANTAATNDILQLNSSGIWVNANLATAGIANLSGATFTGNVAGTNANLSGNVNATTFNGSGSGLTSIPNSATTANSANGASTMVARDSNGSFTANVVTATTLVGSINAATITGTVANGTTTTAASGVGYMGMPQNIISANTVAAAENAGKHLYVDTGGRTLTIPSNANVAFPIGTTIVIVAGHSTGNTTITIQSTDTLRLSVVGTTGSRTLAAYGMATLVKVAATTWFISGNGLT